MWNKSFSSRVLIGLAAVGLFSGCSGAERSASKETQYVSGSRVKIYRTLSELTKDSDLVAKVRILNDTPTIEQLAGLPYSILQARVDKVRRSTGKTVSEGDTISVRFLGSKDVVAVGQMNLEPNADYLLFLNEFKMTPDGPTNGQYVIVGVDAGMFRLEGKGKKFSRQGKDDVELPLEIDEADVPQ